MQSQRSPGSNPSSTGNRNDAVEKRASFTQRYGGCKTFRSMAIIAAAKEAVKRTAGAEKDTAERPATASRARVCCLEAGELSFRETVFVITSIIALTASGLQKALDATTKMGVNMPMYASMSPADARTAWRPT
jgi:hypothetical protein